MTQPSHPSGPADARLLWDALERASRERPDQIAVAHPTGRISYAELVREANALAQGLLALGAKPGDTISYQMPNCIETTLIVLAAMRIGAICNPIITIYRAREVSFILQDAKARFVFCPATYRGFDYARMLAPLAAAQGTRLIVCDDRARGVGSFRHLVDSGRERSMALPQVDPAADALYLYTSGTEGKPKGVRHSQATLLAEARSVCAATALTSADTLVLGSPLSHITGFMYAASAGPVLGAKVCLLDIWNVHEAASLIEREQCTWTVGATPFLQMLLEEPGIAEQIRSLRIFRCGGADVPPQLIRRAQERGIRAMRTYGCSEHPTVSGGVAADPAKASTTDGRVHVDNRVRIVDLEVERVLPTGEVGEIQTSGPELFLGYVDRSLDKKAFTPDGWFKTGDLGRLDGDSYLTIVGRRKDIIIRKGENISAKEVEDLILELPEVRQCAVIGVPDRDRGEMVVAVCVPAENRALTLDRISAHLAQAGIARQKFPEKLEMVGEMPMTAAGKIRKVDLRTMFSTAQAADSTNVGR